MDFDLLQNIIRISPGFFGIAANKLIDGDAGKVNIQDDMLKYFLYNAAAWMIAHALPFGYQMGAAVVIASVLGALWQLVLKKTILRAVNMAHERLGQNPVALNNNMLDCVLVDGRHHYLKIYKGGTKIAEGIFEYLITPENSLSLLQDKEWQEWFAANEHQERYITFADKDFYIVECVFPE